jgi:beta propeller repeat protein
MCNEGGRERYRREIKKNLIVFFLFSALFMFLFSIILVGPVLADKPTPPPLIFTITAITTNTSDTSQKNADISSNWIVWEEPGGGYYDIYAYNTDTGEEILLTPGTPDSSQVMPSVSGSRVVWTDYRDDEYGEIWLYDLITGNVSQLTQDADYQKNPVISGDRVIWIDYRNGRDIYLSNLSTGGNPQRITGFDAVPVSIAISGDNIVWEDRRIIGYEDIYLYNLLTGEEVLLTPDTQTSSQRNPVISGNYVVWEDYRDTQSDIYFKDIESTRKPASITPGTDDSDQVSPAISGDRVLWQDRRSLENSWDIYLYEISTGVETILTPGTGASDQMAPSISGSRVVYEDWSTDKSDIYLATIGVEVICPDADFSANDTFGNAPLAVQFTDLSSGSLGTWWWKFGDGSESNDPSPVHNYTGPGLYSVTLTVSTPYCRDAEFKEEFVTVGAGPKAKFSSNVTEGIAPLTIQFTDESTGEPDIRSWDFGDGDTSVEKNPVHTYQSGGTYTVSLEVSSTYGSDSVTRAGYITVLDVYPSTLTTAFPGLSVMTAGDVQHAVFNTSMLPDYLFNATENASILIFTPPITSGFEEITLYADSGFTWTDDSTLEGDISGAVLRSFMIGTVGFPPEIGDATVGFELNFSEYPVDNSITVSTWENSTPNDFYNFRYIVLYSQWTSVMDVAYTMLAEDDGIPEGNATIRMSVNADWVEEMGGTGFIKVIRIGDDDYGQVLPTVYISTDIGTNMATFEAESPRGLSKFGLSGITGTGNPLQLVYLSVTQPTPGPTPEPTPPPTQAPPSGGSGSSGSSGGGGGGGGSYGGFAEYPTATATEIAPDTERSRLECDPSCSFASSATLSSTDGTTKLVIPSGAIARDADGSPLSLVAIEPVAAEQIPPDSPNPDLLPAGYACNLQPDGATFDPPITLTFTVAGDEWQEEGSYRIGWWDEDNAGWIEVNGTVIDFVEKTVSAPVSHFCIYALFVESVPPAVHVEAEPSIPAQEPQGTITGFALVTFLELATKNPFLLLAAIIILVYVVYWIRKK